MPGVATGENWPGWRGDGNGVSEDRDLPLYWSADQGIAWKTPLPGDGNSSPVIWSDRVFLTASTDAGKKRLVLCLDRNDGHRVWQTELPAERAPETYVKNGYASATPVTDGKQLFAFFDSPGLVALDLDGKVLWTRDLGPFKNSYNMASSPVLCGDLVIECCDQDQGSFIVALDKATGAERWRTPRPTMSRQFSTPLVITVAGKPQIVANGQTVIAYDPADGKEIWSCRGMMPNVTPSAVFVNGLVYATSGRNGPAMAIDARGTGDITESKARMLATTGGPYVPSPLACPDLILPADDGVLRMLGDSGTLFCELRIPGHYTASPVAAYGRIYWPSEKGDVAVVFWNPRAPAPVMGLRTVNRLGARCLASPAIAGGRLFIRTEKDLFCIAGVSTPVQAVVSATGAPTAADFATLAKRFKEHPAAEEGADIAIRLEIVESFARTKEAQAVPLLLEAAQKDPHWDVSEAATKALAAIGEPAVPALLTLVEGGDWRPYLKIIPAQALGAMQRTDAVPALVKIAGHNDPLVRVTALQALAEIAAAKTAEAPKVLPALVAGIDDRDAAVRVAALNGVARLAQYTGEGQTAVQAKVQVALDSQNPRVAEAALAAARRLKTPEERLMRDTLLYGEHRPEPVVQGLRAGAGPEFKFQDGELRFVTLGFREIVRRIYFAVRDERWDTVMPQFSEIDVQKTKDGFHIKLAATCRNDVADFSWTGEIVGTPDGKITFTVEGWPNRDFTSPRCGLNILYGSSLAGLEYTLTDDAGKTVQGTFPTLVANQLLSQRFSSLSYREGNNLIEVSLAPGSSAGMEDQRNFGDSSYKEFSSLAFPYPTLKKGQRAKQILTLQVRYAPTQAPNRRDRSVILGHIPRFIEAGTEKTPAFVELNQNPGKLAGAEWITFGYNPTAHMPDDDTLLENCPAIIDQVATLRAIAPKAKFRISPVGFNSPYPRPGPDPRNKGMFAAAWTVRMVANLALANVAEAAFTVDPMFSGPVLEKMKLCSGWVGGAIASGEVPGLPPGDMGVQKLVVTGKTGGMQIWLANLSAHEVPHYELQAPLRGAARIYVDRLEPNLEGSAAVWRTESVPVPTGESLIVRLPPFGVCVIRPEY